MNRLMLAACAVALLPAAAHAETCVWAAPGVWSFTPDSPDDAVVLRSGPDLAWDAALPATVASWTQKATYTNTVTIETAYGAAGFTNLTITGDCVISNGAWTHKDNAGGAQYRLRATVGGDFLLATNARIAADRLGYDTRQGPGAIGTLWYLAAGHGGLGSIGDDRNTHSDTYGSITRPVNLGSGGGEGTGGGAVYLDVAGSATLEAGALISANGRDARGPGAGGSVFLRAASLSGGGTIRADGGNRFSNRSYGGGGGRIAVLLTEADETFAAFTAAGGTLAATGGQGNPQRSGAAGTVYMETEADEPGHGTLVLDNAGRTTHGIVTTRIPADHDLAAFSEVVIRNEATLGIRAPATPLPYAELDLAPADQDTASVRVEDDTNVLWPDTLTIAGYTLIADGASGLLTNVVVGGTAAGRITHPENYQSRVWAIDLALAGDLSVETNGAIDVTGMGFDVRQGPGAATQAFDGGGYGGLGWDENNSGTGNGDTYGSYLNPTDLGSGGNEANGGGAIALRVAGATTVKAGGLIRAQGETGRGAGSGGSVNLRTHSLAGGGAIRAEGGSGGSNRPSPGGGGRVAVALTGAGQTFEPFRAAGGTVSAYGGQYTPLGRYGAAGTVYLQDGDEPDGAGTVYIDNDARLPSVEEVTHIPPSNPTARDDLRVTAFVMTNSARVRLPSDAAIGCLTVHGGALVDVNGNTLSVLPDLTITGSTYGVGTYAAADLGPLFTDSAGGGSVVVRPLVDNAAGATNVTTTNAFLNGHLYAGDASTAVFALWGLSDGTTNLAAWGHTNAWPAPRSAGLYTTNVAAPALLPSRMYYYRLYMTNAARENWADASAVFMTGPVTAERAADASEIGLRPGAFALTRPPSAVNETLTVYYRVGGSAEAGRNYVDDLGDSRTFATGVSNITITVTPLRDESSQSNETVELTLIAGPYQVGTPDSARVTIVNESMPGAPTNVWIGAGNAGVATNWSLGHAPTNAEHVFLGGYSTAPLTWDVTNAVAAWQQTEQYTGAVTVGTFYPGMGAPTNLRILGECRVEGGTWQHADNATVERYGLCVSVGGDFLLGSNASVRADGRGFDNLQGPGKATGAFAGGGHGGLGTIGDDWLVRSRTYGSITTPVNLGSGGHSGAGGGAIRITVAGDAAFEPGALISANGGNARGGGAGGSVYITASSIGGAGGTLRANGGDGVDNRYHGGGGGRVALLLTGAGETFTAFTNAAVVEAHGGNGRSLRRGAAGTVYLQEGDHGAGHGTLIVDNNGYAADDVVATIVPADQNLASFTNIIIRRKGVLGIRSASNVLAYGQLMLRPAGSNDAGVRIADDTGVAWPQTLTVAGYTLVADGLAGTLTNLQVGGARAGVVTHPRNNAAAWRRLELRLAGDLVVRSNGTIHANGRGFNAKQGPGAGTAGYDGGGHGGLGAAEDDLPTSLTYGSIVSPTNLGSGGSEGVGGGAVLLDVAGATTIESNGLIAADGRYGGRGAGAGGSVYLRARALSGGGTIRANGGESDFNHPEGGGGGRVAVVLTGVGQGFAGFTGIARAYGGEGNRAGQDGAAGTVYLETGDGAGRLLLDNGPMDAEDNIRTQLPPSYGGSDPAYAFADELDLAGVAATNTAKVGMTADLAIGDILVTAPASWWLESHTLTVNSFEHHLNDASQSGSGATNRVDHYAQIIWAQPPSGTLLFLE